MVELNIDPVRALAALKLAKAQITIRASQLASCRTCGADLQRFELALDEVRNIITQLESYDGIRSRKE